MIPNELPREPWPWKNFSYAEMERASTGGVRMVPEFMNKLQLMRQRFGQSLIISSAYRSPEHNAEVSSTGKDGPHTTGCAVDILIYGMPAYDLIKLALDFGFSGIGLKQHGPYKSRFVHLDTVPNLTGQPRPWVWTY